MSFITLITWPNLQLWYVFLALRVYPTYICQTSASGPWELLVSFSLKLEITIKGSYAYGQVRLYFHIEQNEMPQKCRNRRVRLPNLNLNLKPAELALNTSISQQWASEWCSVWSFWKTLAEYPKLTLRTGQLPGKSLGHNLVELPKF